MSRVLLKTSYFIRSKVNLRLTLIISLISLLVFLYSKSADESDEDHAWMMNEDSELPYLEEKISTEHLLLVQKYLQTRQDLGELSKLGDHLFMLNPIPSMQMDKIFKVLIWKVGKHIEARHLKQYSKEKRDPFDECSVNNCELTYEDAALDTADAVVFHLQRINTKGYTLPDTTHKRSPDQRWIFLTDEGQNYTFGYSSTKSNDWMNFVGVFNWSMMYKATADVPVPCGRTLPLDEKVSLPENMDAASQLDALVPYWASKSFDVQLVSVMSNCIPYRVNYLKELKKYIKVDAYGKCGDKKLKSVCKFKNYGHICGEIKKYVFYLTFHNNNCDEFIDEKVWTNSFMMGNIPIIMGSQRSVTEKILPPNSFIHVEDFDSPKQLAEYIHSLSQNESLLKYHEWRKHFYIEETSGYSGSRSKHYCRLCEALNFNDQAPKVYDTEMLRKFLDPDVNCHKLRYKSNV